MSNTLNITVDATPRDNATPMLLLREPLVFPFSLTPALIEGEQSTEALKLAMRRDRLVVIFPEMPGQDELDSHQEDKHDFAFFEFADRRFVKRGVVARVVKVLNFPDGSVRLTDDGRKAVLVAYQKRKEEEIHHRTLKEKIPLGLVPHVQARLLARHLRGEMLEYPPFVVR